MLKKYNCKFLNLQKITLLKVFSLSMYIYEYNYKTTTIVYILILISIHRCIQTTCCWESTGGGWRVNRGWCPRMESWIFTSARWDLETGVSPSGWRDTSTVFVSYKHVQLLQQYLTVTNMYNYLFTSLQVSKIVSTANFGKLQMYTTTYLLVCTISLKAFAFVISTDV